MQSRSPQSWRVRYCGYAFLFFFAIGALTFANCYLPPLPQVDPSGGDDAGNDAGVGRSVRCINARSNMVIPQRHAVTSSASTTTMDATELLANVVGTCGTCHVGPNDTPFQLTPTLDGLREAGQNSRMIMQTITGAMPPNASPSVQREAVKLGEAMQAWANQGYPQGAFNVDMAPDAGSSGQPVTQIPPQIAEAMTDLGTCIPDPEVQGRHDDAEKDAYFASLTKLPRYLPETDTDVYTMDTAKMAAHGTYAYAPTYQLWSDDAKKLRLIHVPKDTTIEFDAHTAKFKIPPNTRFYKTFFKGVTRNGSVEYRKVETRLIVTRSRWQDALFGTYIWNDDETIAELHDLRYRDGRPFTDRVLVLSTTDDEPGPDGNRPTRNYAVPGSDRCIQCHTGAEAQNFVLGFTPLQINRRPIGEGGISDTTDLYPEQLSQADRLIRYGLISGVRSIEDLPKLETVGNGRAPRNTHELAVQGYMVGNCAHCHNPTGYATVNNLQLANIDFSAGQLFQFSTSTVALNGYSRYIDVRTPERFDESVLLRRVANDTTLTEIHMPTNVPGKDCSIALLIAKWIASLDVDSDPPNLSNEEREELYETRSVNGASYVAQVCKPTADVYWVTEDPTDKIPYHPRNTEWRAGIADSFIGRLNLKVTPELEALAKREFATNFWEPKPGCIFPAIPNANYPGPGLPEPWMLDSFGYPRQNWGELYTVSPGANVYQGICAHCHGTLGDGQSGAAKVLVALSGYRVANLVANMFGPPESVGHNLHTFDELGENGGASYLVWMGAGGTKVRFPRGFMTAWISRRTSVDIDFETRNHALERHGANMLAAARSTCNLIRTNRFGEGLLGIKFPLSDSGATMWREVCSTNNELTSEIQTSLEEQTCSNGTKCVNDWLDHGMFNAGTMAYFYIRDSLAHGTQWPLRSQCEKRGTQ